MTRQDNFNDPTRTRKEHLKKKNLMSNYEKLNKMKQNLNESN